jgi:hypothetical protein
MTTRSRVPAITLSACVLGLATCPLLYIPLGALGELNVQDRIALITMAVLSSGFLLWRFLSKPGAGKGVPWLWVLEACCWVALTYFVVVVSQFRLLSDMQRVCGTSLLFLAAAVLWAPLAALRRTALEQRISRLPGAVSMTTSVALLATSAVLSYLLFALPDNFS